MSVLLQVMKEMLLIYFYLFSQPKAAKCVFIVYSVCQISCSWIFAISLFSKPPCLLLCLNGKKTITMVTYLVLVLYFWELGSVNCWGFRLQKLPVTARQICRNIFLTLQKSAFRRNNSSNYYNNNVLHKS